MSLDLSLALVEAPDLLACLALFGAERVELVASSVCSSKKSSPANIEGSKISIKTFLSCR